MSTQYSTFSIRTTLTSRYNRPGLCFDFKCGRCRRGSSCQFCHDTMMITASSSSTTNSQLCEGPEIEAICQKWTYIISRFNTHSSRFEAAVDTRKFLQMDWNLIESEDAGTHQYIIIKLSAETGLVIIKTLTDIMDASQKDKMTVLIFRDRTLSFYRIVFHPDVLFSLILKTPVDTIYTFLFGLSGRRGLSVFCFTITALSGMILGHSSTDEEVFTVAISSSLAVLDWLIEINQSAQVTEGFTAIVETISACISENFMVLNTQQSLTWIRRRLNIGSSLPLAPTQLTPQNLLSAVFELS